MHFRSFSGHFGRSVAFTSLLLGTVSVACSDAGNVQTGNTPAAAGAAGAVGTAGTGPGVAGTTGAAGTTGRAGTSGTAGTTGAAGTAGATGGGGMAGTTGTAGTSGAAASAGVAGVAGSAGTGGSTNMPGAVTSKGCGMPLSATQTPGTFVKYTETITASALVTAKWQPRDYWVWVPPNYNPAHAYPTVFVGPGCGGTGDKSIPIQNASGNDAIVVGLDYSSAATGRDCFMTEAFPDPEVNYVEETAGHVGDAFCVDKSRLFIEGFSSGSWIAYLEGCVDGGGGLFKGIGTATGNWQGSLPDTACKGPVAYMGAHDSGDPQSYNSYPGGRDHVLKLNGCTAPPVTTPYDPGSMVKAPAGKTISCVQYMGCKAPTVFCTTTGEGHSDQVDSGLSTFGYWKFWMSLP